MVMCGSVCMAMYGYVWLCMVMYVICMVMYGDVWRCLMMYGDVW